MTFSAERARRFERALKERILVLDGAMGTMLLSYGLREDDYRGDRLEDHPKLLAGNLDLLVLTRPDLLETIYRAYLNAGADIISTDTFNANAVMQERYGTAHLVGEINREAARIARDAADAYEEYFPDSTPLVAGVVGPTELLAAAPDDQSLPAFKRIERGRLIDAYEEQVDGLIEGGADLILIETMFHTGNMTAALEATQRVSDRIGRRIPTWVSATLDESRDNLLSGETLEMFHTAVAPFAPVCVGLNCGYEVAAFRPALEAIAGWEGYAVGVYPSAGLPSDEGLYPDDPDSMAALMREFAEDGLVNAVGGCCGTTPEHIRAIALAMRDMSARPLL